MFKLIVKEIIDNKIVIAVLLVVSFALAVFGMFWFAQKDIIFQTVDIVRAYGFSEKVFVFEGFFSSDKQIDEDISKIEKLECVNCIDSVDYSRDYNLLVPSDVEYSNGYGFYLYKIPDEKIYNPYRMIAGRMPEKANEIMISSNFSLKCGEVLKNYRVNYKDYDTNNLCISDQSISEITVVGIFDLNNQIPFNPGWTFKGDYDGSFGGSLKDRSGYAFFVDIIDSEGNHVEPLSNCKRFIVTPNVGFSTTEVIDCINESTGIQAYDLDSYTQYVKNFNSEEVMTFRSTTLILAVILLTVNVSYGVMNLSVNKRKLSVYYICGLPWIKTVFAEITAGYFENIYRKWKNRGNKFVSK